MTSHGRATIGRLALAAALAAPASAGAACDYLEITPDPIQVAGRPQAMRVAAKNTGGLLCALGDLIIGILNLLGSVDYKAWITRTASVPGGAAPTISGVILPSSKPGWGNITLNFNQDGRSTASLNLDTTDVGQYYLNVEVVRKTLLGIVVDSTSGVTAAPITTRPFGLAISTIKTSGGVLNPGGTAANSTVFAKAGEGFQATVGAYRWAAVDDANNDGVPDAGANLTDNLLTVSFSSADVTFTAETPITPDTGTAGAVSTVAAASFAGGTGTATISYSDVGSIYLRPGATFLGATLPGTPAGPVGRFIPDHFVVSASTVTNRGDLNCAASTFTYMDEPMKLEFTLTAQNVANATTVNYTGAFARLDATAAANWPEAGGTGSSQLGLAFVDTDASITTFPNRAAVTGTTAAAWDKGVGSITTGPVLRRPTGSPVPSPDGPYTHIEVGIAPVDPDGVTVLSGALNLDTDNDASHNKDRVKAGGLVGADFKNMRFGRLRLLSAHGSELLRLPVPLFAEYWNGSGFIKNRDDGCTQIAVPTAANGGLVFAAQTSRNQLASGETTASLGGVAAGSGTFASGDARLWLSAPGAGNYGYVNLSLTAPDYLRYNWNGTPEGANWFDDNPTARARFGVYKSPNEFIYLRENY